MSSSRPNDDIALISSSVELPNGRTIPNRLVKVAMEEGIAVSRGLPGIQHRRLYSTWAEGGWGIIVTGNVQVDPRHLATPHDLYIPDASAETIAAYKMLKDSITNPPSHPPSIDRNPGQTAGRSIAIAQLSHPGLQSSPVISLARAPWSPALSSCSNRPDLGTSFLGKALGWFFWPVKSRRLNPEEWVEVVQSFVDGAKVMERAGWDGVQVHSAHGYLLAEYLSALTNPDPEPLPGAPPALPLRLHLLYLILHGIYEATEKSFILAVKINSSDFAQGGLDEEQSSQIIKEIVSWGIVDILEVSGGTYATPAFATGQSAPASRFSPNPSSKAQPTRQSLFSHFTSALLPHLPTPPSGPAIILTGGMHDRSLIASSLRNRACDLAGIGRPACLEPHIPNKIILNNQVAEEHTSLVSGENIPGSGFFKWLAGGRFTKSAKITNKDDHGTSETTDPYETSSPTSASNNSQQGVPLVGASISILWHEMQLCRLGRGVKPDIKMNWLGGLFVEFIWYGLLGGGPLAWFSR